MERQFNKQDTIINFINSASFDEILVLIYELQNLIESDYVKHDNSPFNFLPNDDQTGIGGCKEIGCKLKRAEDTAMFSVLYSNSTNITLNVLAPAHYIPFEKLDKHSVKYALLSELSVLSKMLPAIKIGTIKIINSTNNLCPDCMLKEYKVNPSEIAEKVYIELVKKASVNVLEKNKKGFIKTIEFKGIDEFISHGHTIMRHFDKPYLTEANVAKEALKGLVEEESFNTLFLKYLSKKNNCNYLTGKYSDSYFLDTYNGLNEGKAYKTLHEMPIISEASLEQIIRLRELENDAFINFRNAMYKLINENLRKGNELKGEEIYKDIVYPELEKLTQNINKIKAGMFQNTLKGIVIGAACFAFGSMGFHDPALIPLGATLATATAGIGVSTLTKKHSSPKENDFYFYWKIKQAVDKQKYC